MKKLIIILITLLFCGCEEKILTYEKNFVFEYNQIVSLYDIIISNDINTKNFNIDTSELGKYSLTFKIENQKYILHYSVVDSTSPILQASSTYYIEKGKKLDLKSKLFFGDNYDRDVELQIIGDYDVNTIGEYPIKFVATDDAGNVTEKESKVVVVKKIQSGSNNINYFKFEDLKKKYKTDDTMVGIDVSVWQGDIDFKKVKEAGCEFVMIRIGYGYDSKGNNVMDTRFLENIKKAKEANLLVGLYYYSYTDNKEDAKKQAKWIIDQLNGETLDLPIAFDWEIWTSFDDYKINFYDLNEIAKSFMDEVEKYGYKGMLYGSMNYLNNVWNLPNYPTWLAHYTSKTSYEKDYYIWQLSSSGKIDGINGPVDLDVLYKKSY